MSVSISVSEATITTARVELISVMGRLDDAGLGQLRAQLDLVCASGHGFLIADLSGVRECDGRLFHLLSDAHQGLARRGGRLRLIGMGRAVLDALEEAPLPEVLLMYRASDCGGPQQHRPGVGGSSR